MRFRNYVNSYNRRNRIYSEDDIWQMNLEKLFANEPDIMAQNSAIGIPTVQELEQSPNTRMLDDYSTYGENAEAVARWEAALDDIAEAWDSMRGPKEDRQKDNKDSNDDEDDDSENPSQPSPPSEPQEDKSGGETSEEESSEQTVDDDSEDSLETNQDSSYLRDRIEQNDELQDVIPLAQIANASNDYERFLPGVYQKEPVLENKFPVKLKDMQSLPQRLSETAQKYEGLKPVSALQKASSKLNSEWPAVNYYGIASKLADNEEQNPHALRENDFDKLDNVKDETLKQIYYEKAAQMYGLDPNSKDTYEKLKDVDIVIPKQDSLLNNYIKNSDVMQKWVADNYENIKNGNISKSSTAFPYPTGDVPNKEAKQALFATINKTDLHNPKINADGSLSVVLNDGYDFSRMEHRKNESVQTGNRLEDFKNNTESRVKTLLYNQVVDANNRAHKQQEAGKIKNYILSTTVNYTQDELEEILKKYKKKRP